jgi:hypothetical protein
MNRSTERKIETSLTKALEVWWDDISSEVQMPEVGESAINIMAQAALLVLSGISDAYDSLESSGMLKDESED